MPSFRVTGDARFAFIHSIEANDLEDAEDKVALLRLSQLDTIDSIDIEIDSCVELDEDGEEIL